jgi:hypothetical protein
VTKSGCTRWGLAALLGSLATVAMASPGSTSMKGFRVHGLPAASAVQGPVREHTWDGQDAVLRVGQATLRVSPWPDALERRSLVGHMLKGQLSPHPAGPSARLELSHSRERTPYLVLGTRDRTGAPVLPGWLLRVSDVDTTAQLVESATGRALVLAAQQAAVVRQRSELWCVRLLAVHLPAAAEPDISQETELRFDWAAIRVSGKSAATCAHPVR